MKRIVSLAIHPLVESQTYRAWVHLLLGGAILVPYAILGLVLVSPFIPGGNSKEADTADIIAVGVLGVLSLIPAMMIMLIPATSILGVTAAKALLGVELDDMTPERARTWRTRQRAATWFVLNIGLGGVISFVTVVTPMFASVLFTVPFTNGRPNGFPEEFFTGYPGSGALAYVSGIASLAALVYLVAAAGTVLARVAPVLLGPSPADRLAELERRAEQLVERNRLARELHDSVGHALTVTTLQAAAAKRVIDSNPEFARKALTAIEEAGRTALEDLDNVLGLLRDDSSARTPQRTLGDLDGLLDKTRSAGIEIRSEVKGSVADVPQVVSREAYRIVQEGLTNALRHAGRVPVTLRLAAGTEGLDLELSNPVPEAARRSPRAAGGRGLKGIRERVTILGGEMTAGTDDGRWRVSVSLPLRRA